MKAVVFPQEGIHINVDVNLGFALGLPHVNKKLRADLWPTCLLENRYTLSMTTKQTRSDFGSFDKLRRVLRKVITSMPPSGVSRDLTLENSYGGIEQIVLVFELDSMAPFEDLRINVLPLVMETSSTLGYKEVVVRVECEPRIEETGFSLQTLRINVAKALEDAVSLDGKTPQPEIWVSGLGDVVEKHSKLCARSYACSGSSLGFPTTASSFELVSDGSWSLVCVHPKDAEYRGSQYHTFCVLHTLERFFPFYNSANDALQYLLWVSKKHDIEEWKKPKVE
jgi:autonomous glycyl radical cofactor GrcA